MRLACRCGGNRGEEHPARLVYWLMNENRMKRKLLSGQPAFGVSVMFPSPHVVDMVGRLGFDWVLIDCEHGSISVESVELMVLAAEAAGVTPIARPQVNSFEAICQLMDRGVMGVQAPHVNKRGGCAKDGGGGQVPPLGRTGAGRRAEVILLWLWRIHV